VRRLSISCTLLLHPAALARGSWPLAAHPAGL